MPESGKNRIILLKIFIPLPIYEAVFKNIEQL